MSKINVKSWLSCPALIGVTLLASSTAYAAEAVEGLSVDKEAETLIAQVATPDSGSESQLLNQLETYGREGQRNSYDQVTNVNQLRDVSPTDWAYEALRSLVERYGCIVGYPNQTYRGNQPLSRYEFAAGLNACLNQIERLIAASEAVGREDIETLQRLTQEFEAELATLGGRVDNLEGRVAFLEDTQFSTTTKLAGEVIFALTDVFNVSDVDADADIAIDIGDAGSNTVFGNRFRLALNTSFTGEDTLVTRLAGGNLQALFGPTSTQTFNLGADGENPNNVTVDWLAYYFPLRFGEIAQFNTYIAAWGGIHSDYAPTLNPYFEDFDGGNGALSTFASQSPIYRIGGGSGIGLSYQFGFLENIVGPSTITVGYLAQNAGSPLEGEGVFDGDFGALAQINFAPFESLNIGVTYVRGYQQEGSPTFGLGGDTAIVGTPAANFTNATTSTNTYGAQVAWAFTDRISLSGFFAYQDVTDRTTGQDGEVWSYGAGVAFPDLLREGSVLGIFAGAQPYRGDVANNELPLHIEGFYKYQLNDNISITPGVIWLSNPTQTDGEDSAVIGTLRTTFTF